MHIIFRWLLVLGLLGGLTGCGGKDDPPEESPAGAAPQRPDRPAAANPKKPATDSRAPINLPDLDIPESQPVTIRPPRVRTPNVNLIARETDPTKLQRAVMMVERHGGEELRDLVKMILQSEAAKYFQPVIEYPLTIAEYRDEVFAALVEQVPLLLEEQPELFPILIENYGNCRPTERVISLLGHETEIPRILRQLALHHGGTVAVHQEQERWAALAQSSDKLSRAYAAALLASIDPMDPSLTGPLQEALEVSDPALHELVLGVLGMQGYRSDPLARRLVDWMTPPEESAGLSGLMKWLPTPLKKASDTPKGSETKEQPTYQPPPQLPAAFALCAQTPAQFAPPLAKAALHPEHGVAARRAILLTGLGETIQLSESMRDRVRNSLTTRGSLAAYSDLAALGPQAAEPIGAYLQLVSEGKAACADPGELTRYVQRWGPAAEAILPGLLAVLELPGGHEPREEDGYPEEIASDDAGDPPLVQTVYRCLDALGPAVHTALEDALRSYRQAALTGRRFETRFVPRREENHTVAIFPPHVERPANAYMRLFRYITAPDRAEDWLPTILELGLDEDPAVQHHVKLVLARQPELNTPAYRDWMDKATQPPYRDGYARYALYREITQDPSKQRLEAFLQTDAAANMTNWSLPEKAFPVLRDIMLSDAQANNRVQRLLRAQGTRARPMAKLLEFARPPICPNILGDLFREIAPEHALAKRALLDDALRNWGSTHPKTGEAWKVVDARFEEFIPAFTQLLRTENYRFPLENIATILQGRGDDANVVRHGILRKIEEGNNQDQYFDQTMRLNLQLGRNPGTVARDVTAALQRRSPEARKPGVNPSVIDTLQVQAFNVLPYLTEEAAEAVRAAIDALQQDPLRQDQNPTALESSILDAVAVIGSPAWRDQPEIQRWLLNALADVEHVTHPYHEEFVTQNGLVPIAETARLADLYVLVANKPFQDAAVHPRVLLQRELRTLIAKEPERLIPLLDAGSGQEFLRDLLGEMHAQGDGTRWPNTQVAARVIQYLGETPAGQPVEWMLAELLTRVVVSNAELNDAGVTNDAINKALRAIRATPHAGTIPVMAFVNYQLNRQPQMLSAFLAGFVSLPPMILREMAAGMSFDQEPFDEKTFPQGQEPRLDEEAMLALQASMEIRAYARNMLPLLTPLAPTTAVQITDYHAQLNRPRMLKRPISLHPSRLRVAEEQLPIWAPALARQGGRGITVRTQPPLTAWPTETAILVDHEPTRQTAELLRWFACNTPKPTILTALPSLPGNEVEPLTPMLIELAIPASDVQLAALRTLRAAGLLPRLSEGQVRQLWRNTADRPDRRTEIQPLLRDAGINIPAMTPAAPDAPTASRADADQNAPAPQSESADTAPAPSAAPSDPDAARKLRVANMLRDSGLNEKAQEAYQEVVTRFPGTAEADQARAALQALRPAPSENAE